MNNEEFTLSKKMKHTIKLAKRLGDEASLYPELVSYFIEQKYSIYDELALGRQKEKKPEEWNRYDSCCERAKKYAKELLGL